jgi:hypothetical protein
MFLQNDASKEGMMPKDANIVDWTPDLESHSETPHRVGKEGSTHHDNASMEWNEPTSAIVGSR